LLAKSASGQEAETAAIKISSKVDADQFLSTI
jgi:hypothetical protein